MEQTPWHLEKYDTYMLQQTDAQSSFLRKTFGFQFHILAFKLQHNRTDTTERNKILQYKPNIQVIKH